eukprot:4500315-Pyramimonas_sp.AAC.3
MSQTSFACKGRVNFSEPGGPGAARACAPRAAPMRKRAAPLVGGLERSRPVGRQARSHPAVGSSRPAWSAFLTNFFSRPPRADAFAEGERAVAARRIQVELPRGRCCVVSHALSSAGRRRIWVQRTARGCPRGRCPRRGARTASPPPDGETDKQILHGR